VIVDLNQFNVIDTAINASSNGNNTLISATPGRQIWVLSWFLISGGIVNVTFQDGAGGTSLTGPIPLIANTGVACQHNPASWFQTSTGNLLNLNLSAGVQVSGVLTYILY